MGYTMRVMNMLRRLGSVLVVGALGAGLLAGCSSSKDSGDPAAAASQASNGASLSVDVFAAFVAEPGVHVIDVRTPDEYATSHLAGAINMDVQGTFATDIANLDKDASYALYCRTGGRSGSAKQMMLSSGFTHVVDLSGGIEAWTKAGKPVAAG